MEWTREVPTDAGEYWYWEFGARGVWKVEVGWYEGELVTNDIHLTPVAKRMGFWQPVPPRPDPPSEGERGQEECE